MNRIIYKNEIDKMKYDFSRMMPRVNPVITKKITNINNSLGRIFNRVVLVTQIKIKINLIRKRWRKMIKFLTKYKEWINPFLFKNLIWTISYRMILILVYVFHKILNNLIRKFFMILNTKIRMILKKLAINLQKELDRTKIKNPHLTKKRKEDGLKFKSRWVN